MLSYLTYFLFSSSITNWPQKLIITPKQTYNFQKTTFQIFLILFFNPLYLDLKFSEFLKIIKQRKSRYLYKNLHRCIHFTFTRTSCSFLIFSPISIKFRFHTHEQLMKKYLYYIFDVFEHAKYFLPILPITEKKVLVCYSLAINRTLKN